MEYLSNDKILVIDLSAAEVEEEELTEDLVQEKIGGIGITKYLYDKYKDDDPIVVNAGSYRKDDPGILVLDGLVKI